MKHTKELDTIMQALYYLHFAEQRKDYDLTADQIDNLLIYTLFRVFDANARFLTLCCATSETKDILKATETILERDTKFKEYIIYMEDRKVKPYTTQAHINSLDGKLDEITVLEKIEDAKQPYYIVDYKGSRCTAIFNWFTCSYYADDIYGRVEQ